MIPPDRNPRPSELYEKLVGKYIQVQGGNTYSFGKLRSIDLGNGVLVLDEVPVLDTAKRAFIRENSQIIHFSNEMIGELTPSAYERLAAEFAVEIKFIGRWVSVDSKYFGKLDTVHVLKYELNPAVVELQPRQWGYTDGSLFIPRDFLHSIIIPVGECYVHQLLADSAQRASDERLREKLVALETRRHLELYGRKAELEVAELEFRALQLAHALKETKGEKPAEKPAT